MKENGKLSSYQTMTKYNSAQQTLHMILGIDGLVQERRNSNALAMELRLSCTKPSVWL